MKRHKRHFDDDRLDRQPLERVLNQAAAQREKTPIRKQSYEASQEVQLWLREQALDASHKPPFEPSLFARHREAEWILSSLRHFYELDLISDVIGTAKSGKEATVYCCVADSRTGLDYLAAKVYRPRMFRSLSNDAIYRNNRVQRDERGRVIRDGRKRNTKQTRAKLDQVSNWISYEFQTQQRLYNAGADVPQPIAQIGNALLMSFVGTPDQPAPRLNEVRLDAEEAQRLFEQMLRNIELFLACDAIHGDLSAYNILYWEGRATIIDFAQAVDPRQSDEVYQLLERDIDRVYRYVAPYGVRADPAALAHSLWMKYLTGSLEVEV
jgi:Serine/threonine protein kinase involved in cell cycle control